jgi:hypothetical protein
MDKRVFLAVSVIVFLLMYLVPYLVFGGRVGFATAINLMLNIAPLSVPANVWTLIASCAAYIILGLVGKEPSRIEQYSRIEVAHHD